MFRYEYREFFSWASIVANPANKFGGINGSIANEPITRALPREKGGGHHDPKQDFTPPVLTINLLKFKIFGGAQNAGSRLES